jgi:polyisoprenoid-binding protein YceI
MQKMKLFCLLLAFSLTLAAQTQRKITKSSVSFRIKNAGSWVDGTFGKVNGTIKFDENGTNNSIDASVEANTASTKNEMRDKHLKKEDFFDVEKVPLIKIVSQKIMHKADNNYEGDFKVTIKNTTKNMSIPFTYKNGLFSASFPINRQDFNVGGGTLILSETAYVVVVFATE